MQGLSPKIQAQLMEKSKPLLLSTDKNSHLETQMPVQEARKRKIGRRESNHRLCAVPDKHALPRGIELKIPTSLKQHLKQIIVAQGKDKELNQVLMANREWM